MHNMKIALAGFAKQGYDNSVSSIRTCIVLLKTLFNFLENEFSLCFMNNFTPQQGSKDPLRVKHFDSERNYSFSICSIYPVTIN